MKQIKNMSVLDSSDFKEIERKRIEEEKRQIQFIAISEVRSEKVVIKTE